MDGNGRWAERRGLPKVEGHRQGARQVTEVLKAAQEYGVEFLTLYAFSTENWKRPVAEVTALMGLLEEFIDDKLPELMKNGIRLRTIGRTEDLFPGARKKLLHAIEMTEKNNGGTLNLALNYGGRAEIVDAVNKMAAEMTEKGGRFPKVTEESFRNYLYAPDIPDPDLLIRTSGELRLSNFLLWELSYSEMYVTDTLWPDFGKKEFGEALEAYGQRDRRFGGRK
ncbi:di-trans,poly-cis-decaprenylcistransferase [Victivallis vadensis]|uniref:Isoprenyl transferase n=2 Tax=Victivallis vadensis TaxID=172901 RepID=A0A848B1V7_9BACT|nr:di-trans,poly-cis-decaprenylcistransferase [Victivallis vadensis]